MTVSPFHKRATALEDAFFHEVDQQLILKLEETRQLEADEDALTVASGIVDRAVLDELLNAQITPKTLVAFSLFPAVHVAWADGHIEIEERKAILKAAEQQGIEADSPACELLHSWLKKKPSEELFQAWKSFIHAVHPTLSAEGYQEMRESAMNRAQKIAEAAGGFLGLHKVSDSETAAIKELDTVFDDLEAPEPAEEP